jgi:pro-sigmaK processing inhibitor BofA
VNLDINFLEIIFVILILPFLFYFGSFKNIFKLIAAIIISFLILSILNYIGAGLKITLPINFFSIITLSLLGLPGAILLLTLSILV